MSGIIGTRKWTGNGTLGRWLPLFGALTVATALKAVLLTAEAVPFNSDEAIVALMARHILQGERPIFFYGQAYMGSLDAWLVAAAYQVFGEGVLAIRLVQLALYLAYLATSWGLARRLFSDRAIANLAAILAAVPPVLVTTYTTSSLGGYGESLVLGNLILWLGYEVIYGGRADSWKAWLALGLVGGLAFWTLGMAGVYLLPVALLGLPGLRLNRLLLYLLCAAGFFLASSPWWAYNFSHDGAAIKALTESTLASTGPVDRLIGLLLVGLPTLLGFRPPWSPVYAAVPVTFGLLCIYAWAVGFAVLRARREHPPLVSGPSRLLGAFVIVFFAVFVGTHFGLDATGRYLLPLYLPLVLVAAAFIREAWQWRAGAGAALLAALLLLNGLETWRVAMSEAGLTTQFDPITQLDNRHDGALINFLRTAGETRGYTSYWASFRIAFLSQEAVVYDPRLPYKLDMSYTPRDSRYPPYSRVVDASPKVAYITTPHPTLDETIRAGLARLHVSYREIQIGPYHVFYHLSRRVEPIEMGLGINTYHWHPP